MDNDGVLSRRHGITTAAKLINPSTPSMQKRTRNSTKKILRDKGVHSKEMISLVALATFSFLIYHSHGKSFPGARVPPPRAANTGPRVVWENGKPEVKGMREVKALDYRSLMGQVSALQSIAAPGVAKRVDASVCLLRIGAHFFEKSAAAARVDWKRALRPGPDQNRLVEMAQREAKLLVNANVITSKYEIILWRVNQWRRNSIPPDNFLRVQRVLKEAKELVLCSMQEWVKIFAATQSVQQARMALEPIRKEGPKLASTLCSLWLPGSGTGICGKDYFKAFVKEVVEVVIKEVEKRLSSFSTSVEPKLEDFVMRVILSRKMGLFEMMKFSSELCKLFPEELNKQKCFGMQFRLAPKVLISGAKDAINGAKVAVNKLGQSISRLFKGF